MIQGPGADQITVDGNDNGRIFSLYYFDGPNESVEISGLTLTGGYDDDGGAVAAFAGGMADAPDVTIAESILTENEATEDGGAIYANESAVTITGSQITDNDAGDDGGAVHTYYSNLDGSEDHGVTISSTVISGNTADDDSGGAKLYAAYDEILVQDSTISDNTAADSGGGLTFYGNEDGAGVTISGSTISGNEAVATGGGIALFGTYSPSTSEGGGPALIENSTISGNSAGDEGGGVYSYNSSDTPRTIRNATIVGNEAGAGRLRGRPRRRHLRVPERQPAGRRQRRPRALSTIVAGNGPEDLTNNEDPEGSFIVGHSLIEDPDGAEITENPAGSNITNTDPELGPLAANGGPTETHLPALASPALDAGIANGLTSDQRGQPRTFDAVVIANASGSDGTDIGATELQPGENDLPGNAECQGAVVGSKTGTEANDTLTGTDAPDALFGAGGDDALAGLGGNDCLSGDAGKDKATGGGGKDLVKGQAGKDKLKGQGGKDKLKGAGGKDKANGGGGKDKVSGGAGKDKVSGGPGKDKLKGNGGSDKLKAARRQARQGQLRRRQQGQGHGRRQGQGLEQLRDGEGQGLAASQ